MGRVDDAMRRAGVRPGAGNAVLDDGLRQAPASFPLETREPTGGLMDVETAEPSVSAGAEPGSEGGRRWFEGVIDVKLAGKLVIDRAMSPGSREQYRRLAAVLHHAQVATGLKVVMIASAVVGEGKTLTAGNLSLTLSESYERRVLLMDADLRRPSLHTLLKVEPVPGLSDALGAREPGPLALHHLSERLTLLTAGRPTSNPMAGLTSQQMKDLLDEARDTFDWVIIDTPPIALMPDANLLAAMADGALLVVKAGSTPYQIVERAVEALGRDRLLGAVLNRATDLGAHESKYYGSRYYNSYYGQSAETPSSSG